MADTDHVDWDAVHDGIANEEDFARWAEAESDEDLNVMTERECVNCGDRVLILSSRDWCDGCENDDDSA